MNRLQRVVVLLALIEKLKEKGSWCGETHIQKAAYFLQNLLNVPLDYEFVLYRYGPFSFELSDEIMRMRADGLLEYAPKPPYGASFYVDTKSEHLRRKFTKTTTKYSPHIELLAGEIGHMGVKDLEKMATAMYVTVENNQGTVFDRARRLNELKPHILLPEAQLAVGECDSMWERMAEGARGTGTFCLPRARPGTEG